MKYLIGTHCINSDHIIEAVHDEDAVHITLASVSAGELDTCATSDVITLEGKSADKFWDAYVGDAYSVA